LFRAADLVVLPYRETLNSGTAMLALSFDRPVLAPALGALSELGTEVGEDWVRTYTGDLNSSELQAALTWALDKKRPNSAPLTKFGWPAIARKTEAAFQAIAGCTAEGWETPC
jgi:glycosyltransferase involved in cell wall biosynthesis